MPTHLWLVGMMGAGKTTVGRSLATRIAVPFVDTDELIVRSAGSSIPEIWETEGEAGFRRRETAALAEVAGRPDPGVIAAGGGAVLADGNITLMRRHGTVVWLTATVPTLVERTGDDPDRPLLAGPRPGPGTAVGGTHLHERLAGILDERTPAYRTAAHHTIDTDATELDGVVDQLEALWRSM